MKNIKCKKINKKMMAIISIVLVAIILITTVICLVTRKDENVEVENTGRIQKQAMNPNNYTMVKSKDGIDVPVPKGYTASSVESESYVNGTFETLYLNKNLTDTFTSGQPTQLQLKTHKGNLRRSILMGHELRVPTGQCKAILEIFRRPAHARHIHCLRRILKST